MASIASTLTHNHLTTRKTYETRTRHTPVNYKLQDEDDNEPSSTQGSAGSWYAVREIIGEKPGRYKILWDGINPETGEPWPADWVKKCDIAPDLISEWEEKKRSKGAQRAHTSAGPSNLKRNWSDSSSRKGINLKRIRLLVTDSPASDTEYHPTQPLLDDIVDSSPPASPRRTKQSLRIEQDEIEDSIDNESSLPEFNDPVCADPLIELSQKSSSFDRESYIRFSDISSQPTYPICELDESAPYASSSPILVQRNTTVFDVDLIIPDSQPSAQSSAFLSSAISSGRENNRTHLEIDDSIREGAQPRTPPCSFGYIEPSFNDPSQSLRQPNTQASPVLSLRAGTFISEADNSERILRLSTGRRPPWSLPLQANHSDKSSSTLHPPPANYTFPHILFDGDSENEDIPFLSLSNSPMAEQFQTPPPPAASPPSSSGRLSLRERLAQSRKGFSDAVSAYKATPTRVETVSPRPTPGLSTHSSSPSPAPINPKSAQLSPINEGLPTTGLQQLQQYSESVAPSHNTLINPEQNALESITDAQPQPQLPPGLQSPPLLSQLQFSFSNLPGKDHEFSPTQAILSQFNSYETLPIRPKLSSGEHVIALELSDGQKEAYLRHINNNGKIIQKFCEGGLLDDPDAIRKMNVILHEAGRISTHLDLATDDPVDWEQKEIGYALLHPKFRFLKTFLDAVRQQGIFIAIFAESGKTLDLLELFLRGIKIRCRRTDGFSSRPPLAFDEVSGSVTVALVPTGLQGQGVLGNYASLVIAIDSTFDIKDKQVEKFRTHTLEVGRLAPVLRLVAANTVEHAKVFLPSQDATSNLTQLMSYVAILRGQAGILPPDYSDRTKIIALDVGQTIVRASEAHEDMLSYLPDIPTLPIYEPASHTNTQEPSVVASQAPEVPSPQPPGPAAELLSALHAGEKRRWEESSSQENQVNDSLDLPEKKRRIGEEESPVPSDLPSPPTLLSQVQNIGDITHVSDSQPSQSQPVLFISEARSEMDLDQPEPSEAREQPDRPPTTGMFALHERSKSEAAIPIEPREVALLTREKAEEISVTEGAPDKLVKGPVESNVEDSVKDSMEGVIGYPPQITSDHLVSTPEPMDDSDSLKIPEIVDGEIDDDFEKPVFNLPGNTTTLEELDREQMMEILKNKIQEFNEWVQSTSRLQKRYEEMRSEMVALKKELAQSKSAQALSESRKERLNAEVNMLKDERKQLKQDLQEARSALLASDRPDVAKMEQLRADNQKLHEQLLSMSRKLESTESELAFVRDAYQTATREGGERGNEAEELRKLNEELRRKADMRVIELRQLQFRNQDKVKDQQIDKLKHQLAEREERIRRLEIERSSMGNYKGGRPLGTRATSVPGRASPSTSRTSSPGPATLPVTSAVPLPHIIGRDNAQVRPLHAQNAARRSNNKE